jgi:tetratricopeptide (TPR) repeat protein
MMDDSPLEQLLLRAERYADVERHDLAEGELRRAIALQPGVSVLHGRLAVALWRLKRVQEAEAELREALRLDPEDAELLRFLGVLLMDEGRHSEAERCLIDAIRTEPDEHVGYLFYGMLMQKTNHLAKAEQLMRHSLALEPHSAFAHAQLGTILASTNRWGEAHRHGAEGLSLAAEDALGHARMGVTYFQTGHPFKARTHLREALRQDPTDPDLAEAYHQADRACRWLYWPVYQYAIWTGRLPGKHLLVWLVIIVLYHTTRHMAGPLAASIRVVWIAFIAFVVYTWLAGPLVSVWMRMRPSR